VIYIKQCFGSQGVQHKGELKTLDDDDDVSIVRKS
jgi:hypothetical protein